MSAREEQVAEKKKQTSHSNECNGNGLVLRFKDRNHLTKEENVLKKTIWPDGHSSHWHWLIIKLQPLSDKKDKKPNRCSLDSRLFCLLETKLSKLELQRARALAFNQNLIASSLFSFASQSFFVHSRVFVCWLQTLGKSKKQSFLLLLRSLSRLKPDSWLSVLLHQCRRLCVCVCVVKSALSIRSLDIWAKLANPYGLTSRGGIFLSTWSGW